MGKSFCPLLNARELQSRSRVICRFQHGKTWWKYKVFIHIDGTDYLLCHYVTSAVAGHHDGVYSLAAEIAGAEKSRQPVDKSHNIRADRIVVIRAYEHEHIASYDGRIYLFHHDAAVKAAFIFAEVKAILVPAATAILNLTVPY